MECTCSKVPSNIKIVKVGDSAAPKSSLTKSEEEKLERRKNENGK
jgi:hypothetical protein